MRCTLAPTIVLLAMLFSFSPAYAQFETVYLGVNGLTCSQCSRTVEMSIRKLDFVADVHMNLQHTEGAITLKKDRKADMDKIAQAVVDAGFSVRYLQADLKIDNSMVTAGACFNYRGDEYVFTQPLKEPLKGTVRLTFVGKKFLSKNEFKKVQQYMSMQCGDVAGKVYHVKETSKPIPDTTPNP